MIDTADRTLDARGLLCPEPVMLLHQVMDEVAEGDVVVVLATDPSTVRDFTRFCSFLGHELIRHEEMDGEFHFLICKHSQ
ncbi:MAG TPA: sulfurtransferase TusA [Oceanospirillales bacterium]|nr:sulfurtransferase TusA [Oceanospirillaceae bacterium]HBS42513.1 sulfurtransferase TusA [Oceanospirillales bacterium]|tara:strand:+ start:90269 stop:90508 length:240 start_codon:yes stop_codon:yes gene_type:complete